jgi:hypothetical protein
MSATAVSRTVPRSALTPRMSALKLTFVWIGLSLVAFPLAGLLGWSIGGHVDGVGPALLGGALTGAGVGLVQWWFLNRDLGVSPLWIPATAVALAVGLTVGAAVVDYETTTASLAIMGAISGAAVGVAQSLFLRDRFSLWQVWALGMPALWALGWVVTDAAGIDVGNQFTVFGAYGSIVFGILAGLLMAAGRRSGG